MTGRPMGRQSRYRRIQTNQTRNKRRSSRGGGCSAMPRMPEAKTQGRTLRGEICGCPTKEPMSVVAGEACNKGPGLASAKILPAQGHSSSWSSGALFWPQQLRSGASAADKSDPSQQHAPAPSMITATRSTTAHRGLLTKSTYAEKALCHLRIPPPGAQNDPGDWCCQFLPHRLETLQLPAPIFLTRKSACVRWQRTERAHNAQTDRHSRIGPFCRLPAPLNPRNPRPSRAWSSRSPTRAPPCRSRGFAPR